MILHWIILKMIFLLSVLGKIVYYLPITIIIVNNGH